MTLNKSHRQWKEPKSRKFSSLSQIKPIQSFEERQKEKLELKALKEEAAAIISREKEIRAEKARKTREKQERKKANAMSTALKHQGVQLIKDPKKLKKLNKKNRNRIMHLSPEAINHFYGK